MSLRAFLDCVRSVSSFTFVPRKWLTIFPRLPSPLSQPFRCLISTFGLRLQKNSGSYPRFKPVSHTGMSGCGTLLVNALAR